MRLGFDAGSWWLPDLSTALLHWQPRRPGQGLYLGSKSGLGSLRVPFRLEPSEEKVGSAVVCVSGVQLHGKQEILTSWLGLMSSHWPSITAASSRPMEV